MVGARRGREVAEDAGVPLMHHKQGPIHLLPHDITLLMWQWRRIRWVVRCLTQGFAALLQMFMWLAMAWYS